MDEVQESISCAAIKRSDGIIIAGRNHDFIFKNSPPGTCKENNQQGFITSKARFVGRTEAANIACAAKQIENPIDILFSEDITGDNPWAGEIIDKLQTALEKIIEESGKVDITNWPAQQQICQAIAQQALKDKK